MVMSREKERERKAKKGLLRQGWGGLDESQGIPELATYTRGPQMPSLSFLCRRRQVPFELKWVCRSPSAPPPALLPRYTIQVSGKKRGT